MADQTKPEHNLERPNNVVNLRRPDLNGTHRSEPPQYLCWSAPFAEALELPTPETMTVAGLLSLYLVGHDTDPLSDQYAAEAAMARMSATASRYIFPLIGTRLVSEFSEEDARSFASMLKAKRSREQVYEVLQDAKRLFDLAISPAGRGNPFEGVSRAIRTPEPIVCPLPSNEQVEMMLVAADRLAMGAERPADAASWKGYRVMLRVLVASGARLPELWALPWENVLFDQGTIVIDQRVGTLGVLERVPKRAAVRQLELPADVMGILRAWRIHCPRSSADNPVKVYRGWTAKRDLIFPNNDGTPINSETFRGRVWHPLMRESGLVDAGTGKASFECNALHYQHAMMMLKRGATGEQINRRLGYSGALPWEPLNAELASHLFRRKPRLAGNGQ